jgi:Fic family protein
MLNQITKRKIAELTKQYRRLAKKYKQAMYDIALAEIPEMVYNSNAIENSTLSLQDTEDILFYNKIKKDHDVREIYEAKNLAKITESFLKKPPEFLTIELILSLHKILLSGINDEWAGRFRRGKEWVRVGGHVGANPKFTAGLMQKLVEKYHLDDGQYFLDKIAWFHAEFEFIHPFCDGNGRLGRALINQQLLALGLPPIIIQNKSKRAAYYPLFSVYATTNKYDGFTKLLAARLIEALQKRLGLLTSPKIIPLALWAKAEGMAGNIAANKAARGSIPAFRMREKWLISENFHENSK